MGERMTGGGGGRDGAGDGDEDEDGDEEMSRTSSWPAVSLRRWGVRWPWLSMILDDGLARKQDQRSAQRQATAIYAAAADAAVGRALDLNAGQRGGVGADEGLGLAARLPGQAKVQRRLVGLDGEIGVREPLGGVAELVARLARRADRVGFLEQTQRLFPARRLVDVHRALLGR